MARVLTIPVMPDPKRRKAPRKSDPRYVDGQEVLVHAMNYLAKSDPQGNKDAVSFLSDHFFTQFRMSDRP
jgi:hypothetical protein